MNSIRACTALFTLALAPAAPAQLPGPGLTWNGSGGNSAGSYLPSCTNLPVATAAGENVAVRVWGDMQSFYVLFAAGSGSQCLPFPGIGNGLILDPPIVTVTAGVLTQITPCLACPPGYQEHAFTIPGGIPAGTALALQAAGFGAGNPSFTVAITATVR